MGAYNVINRTSMQAGQAEDISVPLVNFDAIAAVLNGGIDNSNIAAGANLTPSKIAAGLIGQMLGMDPGGAGVGWVPGVARLMEKRVTPGPDATIDLNNIPGGFKHLLLISYLRGDSAAIAINNFVRVNNDAAASYYGETGAFSAASPSASEVIPATTNGLPHGDSPAATGSGSFFSATLALFPNYIGTLNYKSMVAISMSPEGTTTGTQVIRPVGGIYTGSTLAITRLTIRPSAGNYIADSYASLYGLG